ncbi:hypothetical protein T10_5884 [Trichinella papuae]|uniref:Uncharacterized protein n=1 Tax=Trichinella papuae TaxID=268474 RepID=A0A0V1M2D8_9BILA|nr:hypothetical protein T10_5884 [Trichinella papuae]
MFNLLNKKVSTAGTGFGANLPVLPIRCYHLLISASILTIWLGVRNSQYTQYTTSAKTLRRLFVHLSNAPSARPFSTEQILGLHLSSVDESSLWPQLNTILSVLLLFHRHAFDRPNQSFPKFTTPQCSVCYKFPFDSVRQNGPLDVVYILFGYLRLANNLRTLSRDFSSVISGTCCRCTALVVIQVNRYMCDFVNFLSDHKYTGPHLFLVSYSSASTRSIRNVYQTLLHINIQFGIHPAAATDVQNMRKSGRYISASELSPRSPQSVFTFQPLSSFDEDIQDNKEKLQQRNRIKCLSERATDNHGDKSYCGRPRTKHHAPTLTVSSHANQRP